MWRRITLALFVSLFLVGADQRVCPGQNPETQTFRLNKLDVNGLQKISREKFLEVSGLQLGQGVKFADLKTASNKSESETWTRRAPEFRNS
ncbi:MAG TPA: hypothetical protein VKG02_05575 [Blastocatellia bacterium]|nr:hypothetical protein [Blastocatellia bacterium]